MKLDKKNRKTYKGFLGEYVGGCQMFHCPFCGKILGFANQQILS